MTVTTVDIVTEPAADPRAAMLRERFLHLHDGKPNTRKAYERDLADWFGYCDRTGVDPLAVHGLHVEDWVREVETTEVLTSKGQHPTGRFPSAATVHRRVNTVRALYGYAVRHRMLPANPVPESSDLHLAKRRTTSPTKSLSQSEAIKFLDAARVRGELAAALVATMLYQGVRVGGLCELDVESLSSRSEGRTLIVKLKGGDIQEQLLADTTAECIDAWLATRANHSVGSEVAHRSPVTEAGRTPMFTDRHGRRIKYWHVEHIIRACAKAARVMKTLSPHSLRHTCITESLSAGTPLADVQTMAGHRNADTTVGYDRARQALSRSPIHKINGRFG